MTLEFNLHVLGLPGARFANGDALAEFRNEAVRYEAIIAANLDEIDLWEELGKLGFERDEIAWHINHPDERMERGFA